MARRCNEVHVEAPLRELAEHEQVEAKDVTVEVERLFRVLDADLCVTGEGGGAMREARSGWPGRLDPRALPGGGARAKSRFGPPCGARMWTMVCCITNSLVASSRGLLKYLLGSKDVADIVASRLLLLRLLPRLLPVARRVAGISTESVSEQSASVIMQQHAGRDSSAYARRGGSTEHEMCVASSSSVQGHARRWCKPRRSARRRGDQRPPNFFRPTEIHALLGYPYPVGGTTSSTVVHCTV